MTDACSPALRAWLNEQQHALACQVELSAIYHAKRERYLLLCERLCQAFTAITATLAFSLLFRPDSAAIKWLGAAAAFASIAPMVWNLSARSHRHAVLAGDYRRLLVKIRSAAFELPEEQILAFRGQLAEIEAGEDAALGALVIQCQNEIARASGHVTHVVPLTWWQRATMHVVDWDVRAAASAPQ